MRHTSSIARAAARPLALAATAAVIVAAVAILLAMGRPAICACGTVRLWQGVVASPENSQQLADWYSLSHVVHGLLFYAAAHLVAPRVLVAWRLAAATAIEAVWEIAENSPAVIARYRAETVAFGYSGDSVLNSASDIAMMLAGFAIARRLPAWGSVVLGIALELVALAAIRDNLTLNVLMLVAPVDAVRTWQAAGLR